MWRPQFAIFVLFFSVNVVAQTPQVCLGGPANTNKLICLIPGVYGANGLDLNGNSSHKGHFEDSFVNATATPVSSAIGTQSSLLPLASPSSGLTFTWDPVAKAFAPSTDSLGPILGERAETIGRRRVFVGFSYQFFNFDTLDGVNLKNLPFVFIHQNDDQDGLTPGATTCSVNAPQNNSSNTDDCAFVRDVIKTVDRIDLKIHQFTTFVNVGLTDRIDLSVAIPFENVLMAARSDVTVVHNDRPLHFDHFFTPRSDCAAPVPPPDGPGCLQKSFSRSSTASGIGDVTFRIKGSIWKSERAAIAVGADVRVPTGDEYNFLGSGAIGVQPFVVLSYRSRISPHILVGYQTNESSVVAGDIATGRKERLPSEVIYSGGTDIWITKRLTADIDLVGQQVHQAKRIMHSTFTELGACQDDNCGPCPPISPNVTCFAPAPPNHDDDLLAYTRSYNITNAALGIKVKPIGKLLITANVTLKLNDGGLRAKAVPLVAASYTF